MTLKELHERIGWQLEGRLDYLQAGGCWAEWVLDVPPTIRAEAAEFRRRPDAPEMPGEVWLSDNQKPQDDGAGDMYTAHTHMCGAEEWHGGKLVRYVRADGVIDGRRLQARLSRGSAVWYDCPSCEYRFRP